MPGPRVVHCKKEPYDVYIGRPSKWGNPFEIGKDGNRTEVIERYREWIKGQDLPFETLRGKILGCWCAPLPCHGDVLMEIANRMPLQAPEKPVQTFSEGGSYPTTGDDVKLPSELLIASREHLPEWKIKCLLKNN